MKCINITSPEFKQLLESTRIPSMLLEMKISKWQEDNNSDEFPTSNQILESGEINYALKSLNILQSDKAKQVFDKGNKAGWDLNKILTELQVPKDQKELLLDLGITDREELALELASNYSYSIKIDTTKGNKSADGYLDDHQPLTFEDQYRVRDGNFYEANIYDNDLVQITEEEYNNAKKIYNDRKKEFEESVPNSSYYSNLTVPGGTNYTENEISTPLIIPSIKGHAQFSTDNGIGWHRSDDRTIDIQKMLDLGLIKEIPCQ